MARIGRSGGYRVWGFGGAATECADAIDAWPDGIKKVIRSSTPVEISLIHGKRRRAVGHFASLATFASIHP